jgi:hypothetical protein
MEKCCSCWLLRLFLIVCIFIIRSSSSSSSFSSNNNNKWDQEESLKNKYKIVCYYTNWAQYRPRPVSYFPDNVDPNLCTHIIFAFAKINEDLELARLEVEKNFKNHTKNYLLNFFLFFFCFVLFLLLYYEFKFITVLSGMTNQPTGKKECTRKLWLSRAKTKI